MDIKSTLTKLSLDANLSETSVSSFLSVSYLYFLWRQLPKAASFVGVHSSGSLLTNILLCTHSFVTRLRNKMANNIFIYSVYVSLLSL